MIVLPEEVKLHRCFRTVRRYDLGKPVWSPHLFDNDAPKRFLRGLAMLQGTSFRVPLTRLADDNVFVLHPLTAGSVNAGKESQSSIATSIISP